MYRKIPRFFICILSFLMVMACGEKKLAEKPQAHPLKIYKQEITTPEPVLTLKVNEEATVPITVKNIGNELWPSKGITDKNQTYMISFCYFWMNNEGKQFPAVSVGLPYDMPPGSSRSFNIKIKAPSKPGNYNILFSMIQSGVNWFHLKGANPLILYVTVKMK